MKSRETASPGDRRPEDLGRAIRVLRMLRDMTRPELSEVAEVSYSYLSEIENGTKLPSSRVLAAISDALDVGVPELEQIAADLAATDSSTEPSAEPSRSPSGVIRKALSTRPERAPEIRASLQAEEMESYVSAVAAAPAHRLLMRDVGSLHRSRGRGSRVRVPDELLAEIRAGNCIAFVGAGFSAAAGTPGWAELLQQIAKRSSVPKEVAVHVEDRIARGSSSSLDEAAQVLEDQLGRARFLEQLHEILARPRMPKQMIERVQLLRGIPFRSILTTNFDEILSGATPGHDVYRTALRAGGGRWWEPRYWGGEGAFTVKLHGDLAAPADTVVLTRRDYRRRLYEDPAYETFLRAIMATKTVLYMGFSFEDAYLNELRSEILALLGHERESAPVAYAIVNDVPESTARHYRAHEGIEILSYDTHGKKGARDFSGFDHYLQAIHESTNPLLRLGRHLEHKSILWVDPHPQNNELAFAHLNDAARASRRRRSALVTAATPEQALPMLYKASRRDPFDLVITHWGADTGPEPAAVRLLQGIRREDLRAPVIVFASNEDMDERKRTALGLGAQDYCFGFETLFRTIERVLAPGHETA